jgi:cation diffusion facilitator family transporter
MLSASTSPTPLRLAAASVAVGVAVFGLKLGAWFATGSVMLYTDALESLVNVVAAVGALVTIRYAAQPADARHPFGHAKAEYFSAAFEGALILFAAVEIVRAAVERWGAPAPPEALGLGVALAAAATVGNALMAAALVRGGRRHASPALLADGKHLWTDVVTTLGVFLALGVANVTGHWWIDPVVALGLGAHIVYVGFGLVKESIGGLLDESLPEGEMRALEAVIARNLGGALEAHALRSRRAGRIVFVEFHLVVRGTTTVAASHDLCDRLEAAIRQHVPGSAVTIHVEPEGKAHHRGRVVRYAE